jgi:FHA domain
MPLLALELNDAGIVVADAQSGQLLPLDGGCLESPAIALAENHSLIVGTAADRRARLNPRFVLDTFWDQLDGTVLRQPGFDGKTPAEMAHAHLSVIWQSVQNHGREVLFAVPGFFSQQQLGLLLGIAQELSIPVRGLVASAVAVASPNDPRPWLLHIDLLLHRAIVTVLQPGPRLSQVQVVSLPGRGLRQLWADWMKAIADEFVRHTRFDPLHQAASEQELYDRLPDITTELRDHPAMAFQMTSGGHTYGVTLDRLLFQSAGEALAAELKSVIETARTKNGAAKSELRLVISHRVARLPGWTETLAERLAMPATELKPGAAAFGALELADQFAERSDLAGVAFLTSRPWQIPEPRPAATESQISSSGVRPTHVVYRNMAYPIGNKPLVIGRDDQPGGVDIVIQGQIAGVSRRHCTIERRNDRLVLVDQSTYGTYVDDRRVAGPTELRLGQVIRVGTPGETLHVIACLEGNESG